MAGLDKLSDVKKAVAIQGRRDTPNMVRLTPYLTPVATLGDTEVFSVSRIDPTTVIAAMTLGDATGEFGLLSDMGLDVINLLAESGDAALYSLEGDIKASKVGESLYLVDTDQGFKWTSGLGGIK